MGATAFCGGRTAGLFATEREQTMPHDNPRTETRRDQHPRGDSARSDRSRSEKPAPPVATDTPIGKMGARSVNTGLRMQKQMLDVFEDIGREWFARATSKAELAFSLPNKLTNATSPSDALVAYQEWLDAWVSMIGEDNRRFIADSQKIVDTGLRCFAGAPAGTT